MDEAGDGFGGERDERVLSGGVGGGAGVVDICDGPGDRADEQSCGADASAGGDVAEAEPGVAQREGLPIRGADDDGGADAEVEGAERDGLPGAGGTRTAMRAITSVAVGLKRGQLLYSVLLARTERIHWAGFLGGWGG